ncbi:LysR substrate-binding domain-containing protein [Marinobacter sp. chi1]|uniref:LysR substrate-binding domain-containing protein n=1 Tax=Marinobacter suaedae TaxID=3057675 RepID=A0ABT8W3R1_9GAMM|nr:LysR substrate-binding domain-containing protein [Marinobacter sp. chi1]MDO3722885.1 LysR substrate-binding domain-containing protein [Marinobacter sp. chi1]
MQALPPLRALQAFRYAARDLSFKAAAEALNISNAAVSSHIRGLEEFLGFKLFVRLTREVKLTPEGSRLSGFIETGFQEIERGIAMFAPNSDPANLKVSTLPSFASRWLMPRISRFQEKYPHLKLSVMPGFSLVDFQGDGVDLAIRFGKGNYPGLEARFFMEETLVVVCHQSLIGDRTPDKSELAAMPWLVDDSIDMQGSWIKFQEAFGVEIPDTSVRLSVNEASTQVEAVLAGRGLSLIRLSLVADMLESGLLIRPVDFSMPAEYHYYLVAPEAKFRTEKVRTFVSWLSSEIA